MPGPKPPAVPLSAEEQHALHTLIRAHKTPQHLRLRAQSILLWAAGLTAPEGARRLGTTRATVRRWRRHGRPRQVWTLPERLHDTARPGAPATCSAEQGCESIAVAGEPPEVSGRPLSHGTPREWADEVCKRAMVPTISARHGGRFLTNWLRAYKRSVIADTGK